MNSIYNYNDPVNYIKDYIDHEKLENADFSIRKWSKSLQFNSPSVLIDIINRKRSLKGKALELVIKGLPIDNSEKMYFQAITERSLSKDNEKIRMYDLIIKELVPYETDCYTSYRNERGIDIYSHWVYMAILSVTNIDGFDFSAENIKNILIEDLDIDLVQGAVFQLFENGFLKKQDDGTVICSYTSCTTKTDSILDENVMTYYSMVCDLAKKSIHFSPQDRELQCFSIAIPKEDMPLAKEIIRKARAQIVSLGSKNKNDTVYQGNLMFFPLTK